MTSLITSTGTSLMTSTGTSNGTSLVQVIVKARANASKKLVRRRCYDRSVDPPRRCDHELCSQCIGTVIGVIPSSFPETSFARASRRPIQNTSVPRATTRNTAAPASAPDSILLAAERSGS